MQILIAPNAFKNSLTGLAAAEAIGQGLKESKLNCTLEYFPIGDGGDGTAELLIQRLGGTFIDEDVHDPIGRMITAGYGLLEQRNTAIIELANASGIQLLQTQ